MSNPNSWRSLYYLTIADIVNNMPDPIDWLRVWKYHRIALGSTQPRHIYRYPPVLRHEEVMADHLVEWLHSIAFGFLKQTKDELWPLSLFSRDGGSFADTRTRFIFDSCMAAERLTFQLQTYERAVDLGYSATLRLPGRELCWRVGAVQNDNMERAAFGLRQAILRFAGNLAVSETRWEERGGDGDVVDELERLAPFTGLAAALSLWRELGDKWLKTVLLVAWTILHGRTCADAC
ncbi:hypothetical protein MBLNU459_g8079t2 [Dothideomycetes sp. NU459]